VTRVTCPGCGIAVRPGGDDPALECPSCGTATAPAPGDHGFRAVVRDDEAVARVVVEGEIDLVTAPLLTQHLDAAARSGRDVVEVDLAGVTFMDVRGVNALVAAHNVLAAGGRTLRLRAASQPVLRTLELCGVDPSLASV
jgi:anti-sigma B factor antagonist